MTDTTIKTMAVKQLPYTNNDRSETMAQIFTQIANRKLALRIDLIRNIVWTNIKKTKILKYVK